MYTDLQYLESYPTPHTDALALYRYWLEKRGDRQMPRRQDIDALEIPPRLLPGISIVEVVPDSRRYVYRLVGTGEARARGFDPTGRPVFGISFAVQESDAEACYDQVVATKTALVDPVRYEVAGSSYVSEQTIFLPLSDDGISVDKIIVFAVNRFAFAGMQWGL